MGTRIVQIANFYGPTSGGLRTTVEALGRGYADAGLQPVLVVPGATDGDEHTATGRRITMRAPRLPGSGGYRVLRDVAAVKACLAEVGPDRLEVSDKLTLRPVGPWAAREEVPAVLLSHERIDAILAPRVPSILPLRALADRWNRRLARAFPTIVCASWFAAKEFTRVGASVERVPLGTDLDLFHPDARAGRSADPGDEGEVRLVCVGRLSKEKRPDLAVDALRLLVHAGVPARLAMVGDGPMRRTLERRARSEHLPVTFTGHEPERIGVAALLAQADVALAPCPHETFGLAVLEALACGTPVVCADAGAAPELIAGGGSRHDPVGIPAAADPVAIAAAVTTILTWPADARRAAARRRAESYPWARTVRALLRIHRLP